MVYFFMATGIITIFFAFVGLYNKAEIIISPITGFVIGALVHEEPFTENGTEITEYIVFCKFFVTAALGFCGGLIFAHIFDLNN